MFLNLFYLPPYKLVRCSTVFSMLDELHLKCNEVASNFHMASSKYIKEMAIYPPSDSVQELTEDDLSRLIQFYDVKQEVCTNNHHFVKTFKF